MKYKYFLFDLDDTLYAYEAANKLGQQAAITLAVSLLGLERSIIEHAFKEARSQTHVEHVGQGVSHDRLHYFKRMLEILDKPFTLAPELEAMFWNTFLENITLRKGALEFLQYIQENGGKVLILTDLVTD